MIEQLYDHGLPFSEKLAENLLDQNDRVRKKKASLLIIDGGVGEGKTTLAVEVADYLNIQHKLPELDLTGDHPQLALGGTEFMKNMRGCYNLNLPAIVYDEAGDFSKRGSITRFNQMLNRTFETFRGFRIIVILCLPNMNVLDNQLFDNNIPRGLLHLYDRNERYGNFKAFSLYRMFYLKEKMKKLTVKSQAYDLIDPNFTGHFLDLPPDRSKKLDLISTKGKMDTLKKNEIAIEGLLSYPQLASKLNRSVVWVRMNIGKLNIRHKRIIDRSKYFDESVLNQLSDYLDEMEDRRRKT